MPDVPTPPRRVSGALDVTTLGSGPRVVLVHGSIVGADRTWRRQHELADRFTLVLADRPGFAASPPLARGDFEAEAPLFAELLGDGAHLVGHSYGAVIALFAAALRPQAVRSLTVSEPGSLAIAKGHPAVDEVIANGELLYAHARAPRDFLVLFRGGLHSAHETPDPLPDWLERGARHVMRERPPWEADLPLERLESAPFSKLVVSGGHSEAFEVACDALATRIGARRAVLTGKGHTIPALGAPYNALVREQLARSS
jgi:pimeloyl-ACP methyl ester carboxylesterase